jgi:hypothetical protein
MNTLEKLKHGTLDAKKNLVFWAYDSDNRERWVTPEKFAESREKANKRARNKYWANLEESRKKLRVWHHENKEKKAKSFKSWADRNQQRLRNNRLSRVYGLTNDQYIQMFESQLGFCAICGEEQQGITKDGNSRFLCVDHCHKTGKVRQLLCVKCNTGIGQFNDDPSILKKAMAYLNKHKNETQSKIGTAPSTVGNMSTQAV